MRISGALIIAALALVACEDGAPEPKAKTVRAANPTSDSLKALNPINRHLGLKRGIIYNRGKCKRVDRGAYQQDYKNMAMWRAHCTDTGDWAVFIAPDSSVQAVACADTKVARVPDCKPLAPEPPDMLPDGKIYGKS
jgi:hypothetical protein